MRTGNPTLNDSTFGQFETQLRPGQTAMTLSGTVNKSAILLGLTLISASVSWKAVLAQPSLGMALLVGGAIVGFILALVISFKAQWAPMLAPAYALAEGLFVGAISYRYESLYNGIVLQAALLTAGVLVALLAAYKSGLIKASENFKLGIVAATGGIALVYLATILLGFFGVQIPYIHGNGLIGIAFSGFVVVIAALNLVLDFDFIEQGAESGAPKYMEWYGAFGLLVTLIWLYIEILRLLAKLASRR